MRVMAWLAVHGIVSAAIVAPCYAQTATRGEALSKASDVTPIPPSPPDPSPTQVASPPVGHLLKPGAPIPNDPLTALARRAAPRVLREVEPPANTPTVPDGVRLKHLFFQSVDVNAADSTAPNEIYAVIALPEGAGASQPLPGILVLHGGAGTCDVVGALRWAARGYVAVAVDLPGIGDQNKMRSNGKFKQIPKYGQGAFAASPDVTAGTVYQGIAAALDGFRLLQSLPDARRDRLGIVGISWGGYATTMLASLLGDEVAAAYSLYGCGFYELNGFRRQLGQLPADEHLAWVKYMDPGYRAPFIKCPLFIAAAVNDNFFHPPSVVATFDHIRSPKAIAFVPNVNHSLHSDADGVDIRMQEKDWFDLHLKQEGESFPAIEALPSPPGLPSTVRFKVASSRPIQRATVFYSTVPPPAAPPDDLKFWRHRKWRSAEATRVAEDTYEITIPRGVQPKEIGDAWYGLVTDDRNVTVTTSIGKFCFPRP